MILAHDLFVPLRPRWIGLVAPDAGRKTAPVDIVLPGIASVRLAWAVARLAGQARVLVLGQHLILIGMALLTCLLARVNPVPRRQLRQRRPPVPPTILPKGRRRQEVAGNRIKHHNPDYEQQDPEQLRRHLEYAAHRHFYLLLHGDNHHHHFLLNREQGNLGAASGAAFLSLLIYQLLLSF